MIAAALAGIVLQGGQTRHFVPGRLTGGEPVRCVVGKPVTHGHAAPSTGLEHPRR
jgi:hypothetical protein